MKFTDSATEQTTALTDILVLFTAAAAVTFLKWHSLSDPWKLNIWSAAFGLIALAALLGACAHGIIFTEVVHGRIWQFLNLCLGLAVSLFVVGVVYDLFGLAAGRRMLPVMILAGIVFFLITWRHPGIFFIFIVYEACALLFALAAYSWLAFQSKSPGAPWMAAGVLTSLAAAAIQAIASIRINIIWPFDHNGVFHLVQIVGLILLLRGIVAV